MNFRGVLLALALALVAPAHAGALDETRCCVTPARNAWGDILRRADVLAAFKRALPCPATGRTTGACPGWYMDHVIPLACGGADAVWNLQWLPEAAWRDKSKWERTAYGGRGMSPGCP